MGWGNEERLINGYGREKSLRYTGLDSRLADGGQVVSLKRRPRFAPKKNFLVLISVRVWVNPRATVWLEGLGKTEKSNDLIGKRTRDLPGCSIVPGPTMLPRDR
jgi:hypothetical protein